MKKHIFWIFFFMPFLLLAAELTLSSGGNWSDTGIWSAGNVADLVTENVSVGGGPTKTFTIQNGESFTVGSVNLDKHALVIDDGGTLNVGNSDNALNLTTNTNSVITVNGTLVVWGNLTVNANLTFNVGATGSITIKGNLVTGSNATLDIDGAVDVEGSITLGTGSTATGTGTVSYGTTCEDQLQGICDGSVVLPVELISFYANHEENKVVLNWITASEFNNDYFLVEKSTDGYSFTEIGKVEGQGTSSMLNTYQFENSNISNGNSYYRLKQVDFDGAFEYSDIISVQISRFLELSSLKVYPNPIQKGQTLNVAFQSSESETLIQLYDLRGKLLWNKLSSENEFSNQFELETSKYPKGMLILRMISGTKSIIKKITLN